ncbi:CobW family GTP-binding protein [Nonomuraea sp. M3C6]|uniref:CobW family GTP-binding protein n=1 Tax=Nonomuraea marmarensis TaxID=3351344 RepID=A0ABW7AGY8_9ACTN
MPTPVVLVAGLHADARTAAVDRLLAEHPGSVAIRHDLRTAARGHVRRIVRDASGVLDGADVWLAHGCVPCAVREDLFLQLVRLAPTATLLVVDLWDSAEPRAVAETIDADKGQSSLCLTAVITALDAWHMPIDITRGDRLPRSGLPGAGDERHVAEVLVRQIEYATALVLVGGDAEDAELSAAVLGHLAPCTPVHLMSDGLPQVSGPALCTRELAERIDPATALLPCESRTGEVTTVVWHRLRPLHPLRLFHATERLAAWSVRSRGRFWLASRHDRLLGWDAVAGEVSVRDVGTWLAALPETAWDTHSPARRAAAALDWNPIVGDRVQHLIFIGPDLDRERIHTLLDSCLLTREEALAGSDVWSGYDDPFALVLDGGQVA